MPGAQRNGEEPGHDISPRCALHTRAPLVAPAATAGARKHGVKLKNVGRFCCPKSDQKRGEEWRAQGNRRQRDGTSKKQREPREENAQLRIFQNRCERPLVNKARRFGDSAVSFSRSS